MSLAKHAAAGQAAGYIFQPERALYWLAECPAGASVGVETEDDVVVQLINGDATLEQQKHTVQADHYPFGDRSKDLWNTLSIWLTGVDDGEIRVQKTYFYLTTNSLLPDCIVKRLGAEKPDIDTALADLKVAGKDPPATIAKYVTTVLGFSDPEIKAVLERIKVADAASASFGAALRMNIAGLLHLPTNMAWGDLLDNLGGWVYAEIIRMWRAREPAIITREAFDIQFHRLLQIHQARFRKAKPEHLLPISSTQIDSFRKHVFVKQLRAISLSSEEDEIVDAITDYIRCGLEQFRLSSEGDLTHEEVAGFEGNLVRRWREICRHHCKHKPEQIEPGPARDIGYMILANALEHREPLGGVAQEPYITTGSFHRLSDNERIWWNPRYQTDGKGSG